jgi:hypothetical protein
VLRGGRIERRRGELGLYRDRRRAGCHDEQSSGDAPFGHAARRTADKRIAMVTRV